jgi:translation initiation factor 2 subunit 1
VLLIQDTLRHAEEVGTDEGVDVSVYLVSPPNYRIVVSAEDYKSAESALENATESALEYISNSGGKGSFHREK